MATTPVDRRRHALDMQIRESLTGKHLVVAEEGFEIKRSLPHGHLAAVGAMANELKLPALLGPSCRERDIIYALILARAIRPASKLATSRWLNDTTLGADLGLMGISTDEIYSAMDWLYARQGTIEAQLAKRHLKEGSRVLYDCTFRSFRTPNPEFSDSPRRGAFRCHA